MDMDCFQYSIIEFLYLRSSKLGLFNRHSQLNSGITIRTLKDLPGLCDNNSQLTNSAADFIPIFQLPEENPNLKNISIKTE